MTSDCTVNNPVHRAALDRPCTVMVPLGPHKLSGIHTADHSAGRDVEGNVVGENALAPGAKKAVV